MTVEGFFNPSHILRTCLSREYAFSISYPKHEVRVGHHKGTWFCGKLKEGILIDYIEITDCFSGSRSKNDMTKAFYDQIAGDAEKKLGKSRDQDNWDRNDEAEPIEKFLSVWGGRPATILKIQVVQPGRNSSVDEDTGEFYFSPREEEFCR